MDKKHLEQLEKYEPWEFIEEVLNCIYDRIYVSDEKGNILFVNDAAVRDYNNQLSKSDLLGQNLGKLEKEGWMDESLTMKVIETGKSQGYIYHEPEGYDLLAWANPFYQKGKIKFVVSTEWDLKNLDTMKNFLDDTDSLNSNIKSELLYYRIKSAKSSHTVAKSKAMRELLNMAAVCARSDATVLIQGESGTGKEVLMKYIHYKSDRLSAPLIDVNCGAIPENLFESEFFGYTKGAFTGALDSGKPGYFELANHGTLFLDEIETLPLSAQAKLLRIIQQKEVVRIGGAVSLPLDIKIIAATNVNLDELVEQKKFRKDLFYRLNVIPLVVPPLRERKEDIPELVRHFNKYYNDKYHLDKRISPKDMDIFLDYKWPGNVRELQNIVERAILTTKEERIPRKSWEKLINILINDEGEEDCKASLSVGGLKAAVEEFEKSMLISYLPEYENSRQFGELLGIEKSTVNRKLKKYGLMPVK